ncbi:hypothetical protein BDW68DRAFT_190276 [Aspergillus falconensis]
MASLTLKVIDTAAAVSEATETFTNIYLIDIHDPGRAAFSTISPNGTALKAVLELHPLLELTTRNFLRRCINGLARVTERNAGLTPTEAMEWRIVKENGCRLFAPEREGPYEVFNEADVKTLTKLWRTYNAKLGPRWKAKVQAAVKDRIAVCFQPGYTGGSGISGEIALWQ